MIAKMTKAVGLGLLAAVCCSLHFAAAFSISPQVDFFIRFVTRPSEIFSRPPSVTHWDMTEEALLKAAADLLRDYANPNIESSSTQQIDQLLSSMMGSRLATLGLLEAYYCSGGDSERSCSLPNYRINRLVFLQESVIRDVREANEDVDYGATLMSRTAAAHFDAEQFEDGQKMLIALRNLVVESIKNTRYPQARVYTGHLFHTLQDFYSHSNWIERGETEPYPMLGQPGMEIPPEMIASPDLQTCNNCSRTDAVPPVEGQTTAAYFYDCSSSTNIIDSVNRNYLISGYSDGGLDMSGEEILKPNGKCSHGGVFDTTSDSPATGGINKDSEAFSISPHADLHAQAAAVATTASVRILQDIRSDVDDDAKFAGFLNLELEIPNLAPISAIAGITYVVDRTEGVEVILPQIQASLAGIKEQLREFGQSPAVQFILVSFDNTASEMFATQDIDDFSSTIAGLSMREDDDCTDPSIGALIQAVQASGPGSSIFLFTSASPSDANRIPALEALISEKTVKIFPILTSGCSNDKRRSVEYDRHTLSKREAGEDLYHFIATFSGGQVFSTVNPSDIGQLSSLITFSAIEANAILFKSSASASDEFTFPIDEKVRKVTLSINGNAIASVLMPPEGRDLPPVVSLESSSSYVAAINVASSSFYGEWKLNVSSLGSFTAQAAAASDLGFAYILYQADPTSRLGLSRTIGNPVAGLPTFLIVTVQGDTDGIRITNFTLLDMNGEMIFEVNPMAFGNIYATFNFLLPASSFQVQISGVDGLGNQVSRISTTGTQPSTLDLRLAPGGTNRIRVVAGEAGTITFLLTNFGATANFTIQVTAVSLQNSDFSFTISPQRVVISQGQTVPTTVTVNSLNSDAITEGPAISFVVTASADDDNRGDRSDFMTFDVLLEEDDDIDTPSRSTTESLSVVLTTTLLVLGLLMHF